MGSIAIGIFGGVLSTLGYIYLTPILTKVGIYDTCGINNLHGMPAFFAGVFSSIFLAAYNIGTFNIAGAVSWNSGSTTGNFLSRGGKQMAGIGVSLGIALISGMLTGFLLLLVYKA